MIEVKWIKLHRKLLDNPITRKPSWLSLWVILLLLASHDETESFIWNGKRIFLKRGEFITGRKKLKDLSRIPESTIEDILKYLETQQQIRQQKTTKYRMITILKWDEYQKSDIKTDSRATTERQQSDTIKNTKNIRSKEESHSDVPSQDVVDVIQSFKEVNPSYNQWFGNKTERSAIQRMLESHGKEQLLKVISFLKVSNTLPYVPTVTSPFILEKKWADLKANLQKLKNRSAVNRPSVII